MHPPSSISDVHRLRPAGLPRPGNRLLFLTAGSLLLVSFFADEQQLMVSGSTLVVASFLLLLPQRIVVPYAGCPLCRTPVPAPKGRAKLRKARRYLGSYMLRMAPATMLKEGFRCPCCHEPTAAGARVMLPSSRLRRFGTMGH